MGAAFIALLLPTFQNIVGIRNRQEPFLVRTIRSKGRDKTLNKGVLPRASGGNEDRLNAFLCQP